MNEIMKQLIELYAQLKSSAVQEITEIKDLEPTEKNFQFKNGKSFAFDEAADWVYEIILSYLEDGEEDTPDTL